MDSGAASAQGRKGGKLQKVSGKLSPGIDGSFDNVIQVYFVFGLAEVLILQSAAKTWVQKHIEAIDNRGS